MRYGAVMTTRSKARMVSLAALIAGGALLSACGSSNNSSTTDSMSTSASVTTEPATTLTTNAALATKPTITVPSAPAPTSLQSTDLVVGTGAEAKAGDTVTVQYVGVNYADGKQFDASWDRGQPFSFQLGAGSVIEGWDQGVVGMKVGGRRELIIPPSLGYGAQGNGSVAPNETLIFVVDLLSVQS
jgi:peptidylprolyl isomerase